MPNYLSKPSNVFVIMAQSIRNYPTLLKSLWLLILVSAAIHIVYPLAFLVSKTVGYVILVGVVLVTWYLYAAILYRGHKAILQEHEPLMGSLMLAKRRYLSVLGGNVIFMVLGAILAILGYFLFSLGYHLEMHIVFLPLWLIITAFLLVLFYFAVPLIVLDHNEVLMAFERSMRLVWGNWWHCFIILLTMLGFLFILGLMGYALIALHSPLISIIYNVITQFIAYPFAISVTLVLLNDLKLRNAANQP